MLTGRELIRLEIVFFLTLVFLKWNLILSFDLLLIVIFYYILKFKVKWK